MIKLCTNKKYSVYTAKSNPYTSFQTPSRKRTHVQDETSHSNKRICIESGTPFEEKFDKFSFGSESEIQSEPKMLVDNLKMDENVDYDKQLKELDAEFNKLKQIDHD